MRKKFIVTKIKAVNNEKEDLSVGRLPEVVIGVDGVVVVASGFLPLSQFATVSLFSFIQERLILAVSIKRWIS